jgi:hypothetical protein
MSIAFSRRTLLDRVNGWSKISSGHFINIIRHIYVCLQISYGMIRITIIIICNLHHRTIDPVKLKSSSPIIYPHPAPITTIVVKVKLHLCIRNDMEAYRGSGGRSSQFLDLDTSRGWIVCFIFQVLHPRTKSAHDTNWIESWVTCRQSLSECEGKEKNIYPYPAATTTTAKRDVRGKTLALQLTYLQTVYTVFTNETSDGGMQI